MFCLKTPPLEKRYEYQNGRPTRVQGDTTRPPSVWVEEWRLMSDIRKLDAIAAWGKEKITRDAERINAGVIESIPDDELKEYHAVMKEALLKYEEKKPPAMPCYGIKQEREGNTTHGEGGALVAESKQKKTHQSKLDYLCDEASEEYYALIHTAIPDKKVFEIPGAKAAVDKE